MEFFNVKTGSFEVIESRFWFIGMTGGTLVRIIDSMTGHTILVRILANMF
jgi:hypothetical protein